MTLYDLTMEEAMAQLNPQELMKYIMGARVETMTLTYENKLGADTTRIVVKRDLDRTDPLQNEVAIDMLKG